MASIEPNHLELTEFSYFSTAFFVDESRGNSEGVLDNILAPATVETQHRKGSGQIQDLLHRKAREIQAADSNDLKYKSSKRCMQCL